MSKNFIKTEVVLDIGSGIYPFNHLNFVPKLQIIVEPYTEYIDILKSNFSNDSSVLIFKSDALKFTELLTDNSVDTTLLIDVIEHLDKSSGMKLIEELIRVTSEQIIIFTPLGFMAQSVSPDKKDRWGLHGGEYQEHLSGWTSDDFSDEFDFYICTNFHQFSDDGELLSDPTGAFFAIYNKKNRLNSNVNYNFEKFFKPTPKDRYIMELSNKIMELSNKIFALERSTSWKITKPIRAIRKFQLKVKHRFYSKT